MIAILRCNSIITDSRAKKYIDFLNRKGIKYRVLGWDRTNENVTLKDTDFYKKKSGYNVGGFKAAKDRIAWMNYIIKYLKKNKFKTIHACDLDTAFPAVVYKILFDKKANVIFDIFDWYSDTLNNQNVIIRLAFRIMERITTKYSDHIIICEQERRKQIPYKLKKEPLILPNIPSFPHTDFLKIEKEYQFGNNCPTLTYVGGFIEDRCLSELLRLVKDQHINLLIAGFGSQKLVDECIKLNEQYDNIKYFGKVEYTKGLNIMYNADILYAMYSKICPNNVFAAPNKYYETMLLGKPIISTKGIILEEKIIKNNIGYIVEEDYSEIVALIHSLQKNDLTTKSLNAKELWNNIYCNYTEDFLQKTYSNIIK